jgi:polysaccharide biosynthesis/export protein
LVRVVRTFRLSIIAIVTTLALSNCMRTSAPVARLQGDLDALAYGQATAYGQTSDPVARAAPPSSVANSGDPAGATRGSRAASPRRTETPLPVAYAAAPMPADHDAAYRLDAGDRLRVVVYGQEGLTNTYAIDAGGSITMPLIGAVPARGRAPAGLAAAISARLRNGYIREPSVAVEIEAYRPFFILGEVAAPGQYPYVPHMSVESAVAIAGGFSPRASRDRVTLTRADASGPQRFVVPLGTAVGPGDTVLVGERWF